MVNSTIVSICTIVFCVILCAVTLSISIYSIRCCKKLGKDDEAIGKCNKMIKVAFIAFFATMTLSLVLAAIQEFLC